MDNIERIFRQKAARRPATNNQVGTDEVVGAIGTLEGRIWLVHKSKIVLSKAIIAKESDVTVIHPKTAIRTLERGPSGHHDIEVGKGGKVIVCYCHRKVSEFKEGVSLSLCGRVFIVIGSEHSEDSQEEIELSAGEHVKIFGGMARIRVNAAGHRIYVNAYTKSAKFSIENK
jgi:hypothetical protein